MAKLYLKSVDENLQTLQYHHKRYVDDIRIFCTNLASSKKALIDLTRLLRKRGLSLQTSKTLILRGDEAKNEIDGIIPILNDTAQKFITSIKKLHGLNDPYIQFSDVENNLIGETDETPIQIIRETYKTYFIDNIGHGFDKSLFRFLINRLSKRKDHYALKHSLSLLESHPEETECILNYISHCGMESYLSSELFRFIESEECVYEYQVYQIFETISKVENIIDDKLLQKAKQIYFDFSKPNYLRSICLKTIANLGSTSDLERLESIYPELKSDEEKSDLIIALKRMEKTRRNSFISRIEKENELNKRASNLIRRANA